MTFPTSDVVRTRFFVCPPAFEECTGTDCKCRLFCKPIYYQRSKGCNLVRNVRRDMYGDDKFRAIELKYGDGSKCQNFLMFSIFWSDEDGPQRILGFSLYSLIKLLKYKKLFLHIDATFDGAPRGFYQVVIFSIIDHASSLHTPIFYCPMTKKSEEAYNLLWSHIVSIVGECTMM